MDIYVSYSLFNLTQTKFCTSTCTNRMVRDKGQGNVPDPSAVPEIDGAATIMTVRQDLVASHDTQADATEVFSPEALLQRLSAEENDDPDATVMMPIGGRRPPRSRPEDDSGD